MHILYTLPNGIKQTVYARGGARTALVTCNIAETGNTSIQDIITYYIDDTSQALESIHPFKEARFKLKTCLINQINKRLHTILALNSQY